MEEKKRVRTTFHVHVHQDAQVVHRGSSQNSSAEFSDGLRLTDIKIREKGMGARGKGSFLSSVCSGECRGYGHPWLSRAGRSEAV